MLMMMTMLMYLSASGRGVVPRQACPKHLHQLNPGHQQTAERQNDSHQRPRHVVPTAPLHATERRRRNDIEAAASGQTVALDGTIFQKQRQRHHRGQTEDSGVEQERPVQTNHQKAGADGPTDGHVAFCGDDRHDPRAAQQEDVVKRSAVQLVVEPETSAGDAPARRPGVGAFRNEELRKSNGAEQQIRGQKRDQTGRRGTLQRRLLTTAAHAEHQTDQVSDDPGQHDRRRDPLVDVVPDDEIDDLRGTALDGRSLIRCPLTLNICRVIPPRGRAAGVTDRRVLNVNRRPSHRQVGGIETVQQRVHLAD